MLQDMKTTKTIQNLEAQIARIKTVLQRHGPMRPGSLSRQYNVCGKPGCRCKDREHPLRHGPYYQLNYVYRGKKTSRRLKIWVCADHIGGRKKKKTSRINTTSGTKNFFPPMFSITPHQSL